MRAAAAAMATKLPLSIYRFPPSPIPPPLPRCRRPPRALEMTVSVNGGQKHLKQSRFVSSSSQLHSKRWMGSGSAPLINVGIDQTFVT